jgi:hypothetical protein
MASELIASITSSRSRTGQSRPEFGLLDLSDDAGRDKQLIFRRFSSFGRAFARREVVAGWWGRRFRRKPFLPLRRTRYLTCQLHRRDESRENDQGCEGKSRDDGVDRGEASSAAGRDIPQ